MEDDKKSLETENVSLKEENRALKIRISHLELENNVRETVLEPTKIEDDSWVLVTENNAMLIDQEKKNSKLEENYKENEASLMKTMKALKYLEDRLLQINPADKVKRWRSEAFREIVSARYNELKTSNEVKEIVNSCIADFLER